MIGSSLDIVMASLPQAGHVAPGLPIARALVERGHRVRWYTGREFAPAIEAVGARYLPMVAAPDPADRPWNARHPERLELEGIAGFRFDLINFFLGDAPAHIADLSAILAEQPADLVLSDTAFLAAGLLRQLGGPAWAGYGISALPVPSRDTAPFGTGLAPGRSALSRLRNRLLNRVAARVLFRTVQDKHLQVRAEVGLPPTSATVFDLTHETDLYVQGSTPAFEYPRSDLPEQVRFVGPLLPEAPANFHPPAWWDRLSGRTVVLVTQGTFATDPTELVMPTVAGLADEDVLVVVAGALDPSQQLLPENVVGGAFVPFAALMPHVDVMVTNGGFGGVQFALAHGVPLVVAGTTEDKPEIAARVAWSGVGVSLGTKRPTPDQVRGAVDLVLRDPSFKQQAARIAAETPADPAGYAADLLEELGVRASTRSATS